MDHCKAVGAARGQSGFSYLWTLLLVALMAVGMTVAVELDATAVQRERERELLAIGRQFRSAIGSYHEARQAADRKEYPDSLEDLLQDKRFPGIRRHLRRIFADPMTGKAQWGTVRIGGRIVGVYSLSDQTSIKRDGFEVEEMAFKGKEKYSEWIFTYPADLAVRMESGAPPDASGMMAPAEPGQRAEKIQAEDKP
ncbi:type II secretion system protein [Verminephrobacter aporrectodeae]|uniref:type II secretion system protein n=1 Tax=Verminephrobacter aporrectodeae TaxID=1110389 RepID=UPI00223733FB|nr:type II secretion system protein [Verminephrobacter aporrectodeae]